MGDKLLIIKTGTTISSLLDEQEDFEDWFMRGCGLNASRFLCCAVDQNEPLPELGEVAGAIITGSPAFVTDLAPWNVVAAEYLRELHARGKPILGVCYGHQLLAWAFGGEVEFHPGGREIGTVEVSLTRQAMDDPLFAALPQRFKAQASHSQTVGRVPKEAVLLAGNDFEPHHVFRLGETTWGVQFHPEFDAHVMRAYIRERKSAIADEGLDVQDLLGDVEETPESASILPRFAALLDAGS